MFKNAMIVRLSPFTLTTYELDDCLKRETFTPPDPTQPVSLGFVPARGIEHGPLVEPVGNHWLIKLQVEQRNLPTAVVAKRVAEIAALIEEQTGRKPGKKALKDIKEQATHELLPKAFTRISSTLAWINPAAGLLMIDTSSAGRAEAVISALARCVEPALTLQHLNTAQAATACMAAWLMDGEPPAGFTIDREGELRSEDEMRSVVRYQRHTMDTEEVRKHLQAGMRPTKLALTWRDRVSFVLTDELHLRKLELLDLAFEGRGTPETDEQFDADVAIFTGEMSQLISDLVDALGGEFYWSDKSAQDSAAAVAEIEQHELEGEPA